MALVVMPMKEGRVHVRGGLLLVYIYIYYIYIIHIRPTFYSYFKESFSDEYHIYKEMKKIT